MHISDEGLVAGSVNRAELAAAYASATDEAVRANLAAVGAENGMYVEGGELIAPTAPAPAPEPEPEAEPVEAEVEAVVEVEYDDGYDDLTKEELQSELQDRGLPISGNKPDLVARLREDDVGPVDESVEDDDEE
jgi:SAP domain